MKADKIATGHNADDVAETVLLNLIRGDLPRLARCTNIITGASSSFEAGETATASANHSSASLTCPFISFIQLKISFDPESLRLTPNADCDPEFVISDLELP